VLDAGPGHAVRGRVELPDGVHPAGLRVLVDGRAYEVENADPHWRPGVEVRYGTELAFHVAGDGRRHVRAFHPLLGTGPPVLVSPPASEVRLTVPDAPRVRFRAQPGPRFSLIPLFSGMRLPDQADQVRVRVRDGDAFRRWPFRWTEYRDVLTARVPRDGALWIDLPGLVPKRLEDLPREPGLHDLGDVRFSRGGSIAVTVPGHPAAVVKAEATHLGRPRYTRGDRGPMTGLGPGRFRVEGTIELGEDEIPFSREVILGESEKQEIVVRIP